MKKEPIFAVPFYKIAPKSYRLLYLVKVRTFVEKGDNFEELEKVSCASKRERGEREARAVLVVEALRAQ